MSGGQGGWGLGGPHPAPTKNFLPQTLCICCQGTEAKLEGVADLRSESFLVVFLKPRAKLAFGYDAQLAFIP